MVVGGVGGEVSLVVNVDMSWTIYYSHYLIVMTQMMVGNYRAQMLQSPISLSSGHHHQRRPGERREPTRWDIKYQEPRHKHLQLANTGQGWELEPSPLLSTIIPPLFMNILSDITPV